MSAQELGRPYSEDATPISRFVPASAGVYVNVTQLGEVNEALHRVNAWRWLPYLVDSSNGNPLPGDLLDGMARLMGAAGPHTAHDLRTVEVGIAAASLSDINNAVWYVRLPDREATARWFPAERRTAQADFGVARSFRTDDGLIACEREGLLALARSFQGDSLALTTMYLMRGRGGPVLHDLPLVQRVRGFFPARPLATIYVPGRAQAPIDSADVSDNDPARESPVPARTEFVAALYEADNGLDIAIRGADGHAITNPTISSEVVERLLQLPRTTLAAVAQGVDWPALIDPKSAGSPSNWLTRYAAYLFRAGSSQDQADGLTGIGSSVIVAWDQDFVGDGTTPQLALLVQTESPEALMTTMRRAAGRMIDLIRVLHQSGPSEPVKVEQSSHLGTSISCAPLEAYVDGSRYGIGRILASLVPCWAHSGDWFIVTLGRDHMHRILDAQNGLAPSLGTMREASTLRSRRSRVRMAAVVQGELAADVLDEWLQNAGGEHSLLSPVFWSDLSVQDGSSRKRIGIGVRVEGTSGSVVIGRVYAGTAAEGLLEAGDRIIGVDGALLSMNDPNKDLRNRLAQSRAKPGPTIRVLRGEELRDVVLPLDPGATPIEMPVMTPADAAQEIIALIRPLPFASVVVGTADEDHYSARVSLRFATETTVLQIPPE